MVEWVTDIDGDGVLEYHEIPEDGGIGGGSVEGYLKDGHTINVSTSDELQTAFNNLEGKFCPGTITIQLAPGVYETPTNFVLNVPNFIKKIDIIGAGIDQTIIKKTSATVDYERTFIVDNQNFIVIQGMTVEAEMNKKSGGVQVQRSSVILRDVHIKNCRQDWISAYNNGIIDLQGTVKLFNETSTKVDFGIIISLGSKLLIQEDTALTLQNATVGFLAEMGGMGLVFFTDIQWSNVSTKYSPTLNNHSGSGWNLGTEG